jgi:hypothetical protein
MIIGSSTCVRWKQEGLQDMLLRLNLGGSLIVHSHNGFPMDCAHIHMSCHAFVVTLIVSGKCVIQFVCSTTPMVDLVTFLIGN